MTEQKQTEQFDPSNPPSLDIKNLAKILQMVEIAFKRNVYSQIEIDYAQEAFNNSLAVVVFHDNLQKHLAEKANPVGLPAGINPDEQSDKAAKKTRKKKGV